MPQTRAQLLANLAKARAARARNQASAPKSARAPAAKRVVTAKRSKKKTVLRRNTSGRSNVVGNFSTSRDRLDSYFDEQARKGNLYPALPEWMYK